jgi:hypothetical protein
MGKDINREFWNEFSEQLQDEDFRKQFFAALFIDIMNHPDKETVHKSD